MPTQSELSIKDYYYYATFTFAANASSKLSALAEKSKALQNGPIAFLTMPLQQLAYNFLVPASKALRLAKMNGGEGDILRYALVGLPAAAATGFGTFLAVTLLLPALLPAFIVASPALIPLQLAAAAVMAAGILPSAYCITASAVATLAGTGFACTKGVIDCFINVHRGFGNTVGYFRGIAQKRSSQKAAAAQAKAQRQQLLDEDKIYPPAEVTAALDQISGMDVNRLLVSIRAQFPSGTPQDKEIDTLTSGFAAAGETLRANATSLLGKYKAAI